MPPKPEWAALRIPLLEKELAAAEQLPPGLETTKIVRKVRNQLNYARSCLLQPEEEKQVKEAVRATQEELDADRAEYLAQRAMKFPQLRQRGLRDMIRQSTDEGADILQVMLAVLYDDPRRLPLKAPDDTPLEVFPRGQQPSIENRMAAADWLASRLWGRPVQIAKIDTTERQQLEIVWNTSGLPERSLDDDGDEALIAPIETTFRESLEK